MATSNLTAELLRELLFYDPETGIFTWRVRRCNRAAGTTAGSRSHGGYTDIRLVGRIWKAHRLAWLYMTGEWPSHQIDHINRDKSDTRWRNLRKATHSENRQNLAKRKDSKLPYRGIELHKSGLWRARLMVQKKRIHVGYYKTPEEARAARIEAERRYFTHSDTCAPQAENPDGSALPGGIQ